MPGFGVRHSALGGVFALGGARPGLHAARHYAPGPPVATHHGTAQPFLHPAVPPECGQGEPGAAACLERYLTWAEAGEPSGA